MTKVVLAILFGFLVGTAGCEAARLQIKVHTCPIYARDGYVAAQMRADGRTKEQVIEHWVEHRGRYTEEQWPHAMALLERAFTTKLKPLEFRDSLLAECIKRNGWLGDLEV